MCAAYKYDDNCEDSGFLYKKHAHRYKTLTNSCMVCMSVCLSVCDITHIHTQEKGCSQMPVMPSMVIGLFTIRREGIPLQVGKVCNTE